MLIGEVATKSGLSKDGIRYYESLGLLHSKPIRAGSKTYRDYDDTTLERLSMIALAKQLHFKLREMPEALDRILSDTITREERSALIMVKVEQVDVKIEKLIAARNLLAEFAGEPEKPFVDEKLKQMGLWLE